jgi:4-carboxymuconolactone decarboxylase
MTLRLSSVAGFVVCAAVALSPATASAQDRMPPIPADKQTDAQKKAAQEFRGERMTDVFGPFVPLSRSPQLMMDAARMGTYLRFGNTLPRALSEFAIIQAVVEGRRPEKMTDEQEIIYEFGRELNDNRAVTDATYARAVKRFGEQGVMDLVGLNGFYTLISMVLNVGRTPLPAGATPVLKPLVR